MAMPADLHDGLSPEQTEALDRTAMNGGRVVTDRDLYDRLDDQAVNEPEKFTGLDLTQYLSLGDIEYSRLTKLQRALAEGKFDPAFERHRLGRLSQGGGLRTANLDPDGEEATTARQQLDRLLGAFVSRLGRARKTIRISSGFRVKSRPKRCRQSSRRRVCSMGQSLTLRRLMPYRHPHPATKW